MTKEAIDICELYDSMFKDGEEVVIVTDEEEYFWGILETTSTHCILKKPGRKIIEIDWNDVRFMSHDGFPIKKLRGADGSALIEHLDTSNTQKAIRKALEAKFGRCDSCDNLAMLTEVECRVYDKRFGERREDRDFTNLECESCSKGKKSRRHEVVFGDPFLVENVSSYLINPGIPWCLNNWRYEETILMRSKDGANAMLWDIDTIYHHGVN
jgi:hypothetical protein